MNSPIKLVDTVGAERLSQSRLPALAYYKAGSIAPYEETFPLDDGRDARFVSISFWPTEHSDDVSADIRIYLNRKVVHPEAHTVTTTVLVRDDYQTTLLGVNNLCRPGTLSPCLEPIAGKIDPGDSEWATWKHDAAEERGVIPGYPFKSLRFLSKGFPAEKVPNYLVSRTFVIEAVLETQDAKFDPNSMQPNKLTPMRARGMHLCPTARYFMIKVQQLHRALSLAACGFEAGLIHALDLAGNDTLTIAPPSGFPIERPNNLTTQPDRVRYITEDGIKAVDVEFKYGTAESIGKTKVHSVLRVPHKKTVAVIPIFPVLGSDQFETFLLMKWYPGCGSGNQASAWCLSFPSGISGHEDVSQDVDHIINKYTGVRYNEKDIRLLSRSGVFDVNAGMTNAEIEVVEVLFAYPLVPSRLSKTHGLSAHVLPLDADLQVSLTDLMKDGTRIAHEVSAFATKITQINNALHYTLDIHTGRHWSHALPSILKDPKLDLSAEARSIEETFSKTCFSL